MRKLFVLLCITCTSVFAAAPRGNGSVNFVENIIPILKTKPQFGKFILGTFKFYGDPMGNRIENAFAPALSGARMGPYEMRASWNSTMGEVAVVLVLNTEIHFYNHDNKEIYNRQFRKAVKYVETLESMEVLPTQEPFLEWKSGGQYYPPSLIE